MFFALSTRMIPPVAVLVFYHVMFSQLGLSDTRTGLVLVITFINLGLATWIMKGFFDGVPEEVENIALVNGYTRLYAFWRLVLPMVQAAASRPPPASASSSRGTSSPSRRSSPRRGPRPCP